jgi:hypothetical protein
VETPNNKTYAVEILRNYLPAIIAFGGGFVGLVLAWRDISDSKKNLEVLKEQVQRQYQTQREMNEKTNKEVDLLKLEAAYEKGYREGKDSKPKN